MDDTVLNPDRVEAICQDAERKADSIYHKLLESGVPAYRAKLAIDITRSWCRLVKIGSVPYKPNGSSSYNNSVYELRAQADRLRKNLLGDA